MNVEDIRAKFPDPVELSDDLPASCYCVLGAAIMFARQADPAKTMESIRFPTCLVAVNELGIPYKAAQTISMLNDDKEFEAAWLALDMAFNGISVIEGLSEEDDWI